MNIYHITPVDDLRPHIESMKCLCNPIRKDNLIVHNAFDGREFDEVENYTEENID